MSLRELALAVVTLFRFKYYKSLLQMSSYRRSPKQEKGSVLEFSVLQVVNVTSFALFVAATYFAQYHTNGLGTTAYGFPLLLLQSRPNTLCNSEVSSYYPNLFTPASWTFGSMWGVLFVALGLFTAYQAMPMNRFHQLFSECVGYSFGFLNVLGCVWLAFFRYHHISLSLGVMAAMLGASWSIYVRVVDEFSKRAAVLSRIDWLLVQVPFALTTSWMCIAFTANFFAWTQYMGLESISWSTGCTSTALVANAILGLVVLLVPDPVFPLVTMWSLVGVAWKSSTVNSQISSVATTAALALAVANLVISTSLWSSRSTLLKRLPEFPATPDSAPMSSHVAPVSTKEHQLDEFLVPPRRQKAALQGAEGVEELPGGEMGTDLPDVQNLVPEAESMQA